MEYGIWVQVVAPTEESTAETAATVEAVAPPPAPIAATPAAATPEGAPVDDKKAKDKKEVVSKDGLSYTQFWEMVAQDKVSKVRSGAAGSGVIAEEGV